MELGTWNSNKQAVPGPPGHHADAGGLLEAAAHVEVAVADEEEDRPLARHAPQGLQRLAVVAQREVLRADPVVEQVAQDVDLVGARRLAREEPDEALGPRRLARAQVHVG